MLFQHFYQKLKETTERPIFGISDLNTIFGRGSISSSQLSRWHSKGYISKLKKGLYVFTDSLSKVHHFLVANLGYEPSYISLETALHEYGFIPEVPNAVTSISTKKTYSFSALGTTFYYKKIKRGAFTGYASRRYMGQDVRMAEAEKALVDFLYLNARNLKSDDAIEELRLNYFEIKEKINVDRFVQYAQLFDSQILLHIVSHIMKKI